MTHPHLPPVRRTADDDEGTVADAMPESSAPPESAAPPRTGPPAWAARRGSSLGSAYRYTALSVPLAVEARVGDLVALGTSMPGDGPFPRYDAWLECEVHREADADARDSAWRELSRVSAIAPPAHFETLDTYDAIGRDPRQRTPEGARVVTKSFLALVRRDAGGGARRPAPVGVRWASVYDYLPWEDLREPARIAEVVTLRSVIRRVWVESVSGDERVRRRGRVDRAFGARLSEWNEERVAERLHVLLAAGLLEEAHRDEWGRSSVGDGDRPRFAGESMAFDHRVMLADALGRLRGKMKYLPAVFPALLGEEVTLPDFQRSCEAISGRLLHTANFRRVVTRTSPLLRKLARRAPPCGPGPRAALFAFKRDVEGLRLDPAMRMPWLRLPPGALA